MSGIQSSGLQKVDFGALGLYTKFRFRFAMFLGRDENKLPKKGLGGSGKVGSALKQ